MITEKQIESGNAGSAYVQSMRSRITYLARSRILLSFIIQNLSISMFNLEVRLWRQGIAFYSC